MVHAKCSIANKVSPYLNKTTNNSHQFVIFDNTVSCTIFKQHWYQQYFNHSKQSKYIDFEIQN